LRSVTLRGMTRLALAALLSLIVCACAVASAEARPGPRNTAVTRRYLKARYLEVRANGPAYRAGIKSIEGLAAKVRAECPGVLAAAPNLQSQSEREVLDEVFAVVLRTPERAEHAAAARFARSVRRLRWSDRALTRLVHAYAAKLAAMSAIQPPNLCTDLNAWARSGYTATSAATKNYLRQLSVLEAPGVKLGARSEDPAKKIARKLARFEDRAAKAILRRIRALEAQQQRVATSIFPSAAAKVTQALHTAP
jgi:hypothetical protein